MVRQQKGRDQASQLRETEQADWPDVDALADLIVSEARMDQAEAAGDNCAWVEACMTWFDAHKVFWGY